MEGRVKIESCTILYVSYIGVNESEAFLKSVSILCLDPLSDDSAFYRLRKKKSLLKIMVTSVCFFRTILGSMDHKKYQHLFFFFFRANIFCTFKTNSSIRITVNLSSTYAINLDQFKGGRSDLETNILQKC